jgi:hypothetical protein
MKVSALAIATALFSTTAFAAPFNVRELLTAFVDHLNQLFAIFNAELGVKQHRFVRAGGQQPIHLKERKPT